MFKVKVVSLALSPFLAYLSESDVTCREKTVSPVLFKIATKPRILSSGFVTPCSSVRELQRFWGVSCLCFQKLNPADGCNISFETLFCTPQQVNSLKSHCRKNFITCHEAYFCKYEYDRCSWKFIQLVTWVWRHAHSTCRPQNFTIHHMIQACFRTERAVK